MEEKEEKGEVKGGGEGGGREERGGKNEKIKLCYV